MRMTALDMCATEISELYNRFNEYQAWKIMNYQGVIQ